MLLNKIRKKKKMAATPAAKQPEKEKPDVVIPYLLKRMVAEKTFDVPRLLLSRLTAIDLIKVEELCTTYQFAMIRHSTPRVRFLSFREILIRLRCDLAADHASNVDALEWRCFSREQQDQLDLVLNEYGYERIVGITCLQRTYNTKEKICNALTDMLPSLLVSGVICGAVWCFCLRDSKP